MFSRVAVLLLVVCLPSRADEVTASARVDSTSYLIGDGIHVRVDVTHPRGVAVQPVVGDTLGGFHILRRLPLRSVADTASTTEFVVARYDSGRAILPPLELVYQLPGDTVARTVATNPLLLTIRMVEVDTAQAIRDVKPPMSIPLTLAEIALYAAIVLAVLVAAYLAYRYGKRRKRRSEGAGYVPPPRPAHLLALEALGQLKEKRLWQQGMIKPYYSEVTEIVRRYFENRYGFMALEQTSDEIVTALQRHCSAPEILQVTGEILRRADLVKFAKHQPAIPEHEEMLALAYDIVMKTRADIVQPGHTQQREATADVAS